VLGAKTWGPLYRLFPDLARSDNFPFWSAGLAALLWTDTGDFRNPNYHRPTDTPDTLDYEFMRDVAQLVCALIVAERRANGSTWVSSRTKDHGHAAPVKVSAGVAALRPSERGMARASSTAWKPICSSRCSWPRGS
jgi:hypothetical protein